MTVYYLRWLVLRYLIIFGWVKFQNLPHDIIQYHMLWFVFNKTCLYVTVKTQNYDQSPIIFWFYTSVSAFNSISRRVPPSSLVLGQEPGYDDDLIGVNTRLGLPLCDSINMNPNRASLRTPLLEDDRESCVWTSSSFSGEMELL